MTPWADADALARALTDFCRPDRISWQEQGDGLLLTVAGHRPFRWPRRRKRGLFRRGARAETLYEPVATLVISCLLQNLKPAYFYDIGAARGYFSLLAASIAQQPPGVTAFEMAPGQVEQLRRALARNQLDEGAVGVRLAGLSRDHGGERVIWYSRTRMFETMPPPAAYREAWHRRLKAFLRGRTQERGLKQATVEITSLDHVVATTGMAPGLMKIDVDGYELPVVEGALTTLDRHAPAVVIELHRDELIGRFGRSRAEIAQLFFDRGYACVACTNHNDLAANRFVALTPNDPAFAVDRTGMFVFFRPDNARS
jgi:FkbM family methyltransferase